MNLDNSKKVIMTDVEQEQLDINWMRRAIALAEMAQQNGEVPVGAVLVADNKLLAEGFNSPISSNDPTMHAEIMALREGGRKTKNYRLIGTTLYVTLEPCAMCVGAMIHARIKRLVFGAYDPKAGAITSVLSLAANDCFNHHFVWCGGVLETECGNLLRKFFQARR